MQELQQNIEGLVKKEEYQSSQLKDTRDQLLDLRKKKAEIVAEYREGDVIKVRLYLGEPKDFELYQVMEILPEDRYSLKAGYGLRAWKLSKKTGLRDKRAFRPYVIYPHQVIGRASWNIK